VLNTFTGSEGKKVMSATKRSVDPIKAILVMPLEQDMPGLANVFFGPDRSGLAYSPVFPLEPDMSGHAYPWGGSGLDLPMPLGAGRSELSYTPGAEQIWTCLYPWGKRGLIYSMPLGLGTPGLVKDLGRDRPELVNTFRATKDWSCQRLITLQVGRVWTGQCSQGSERNLILLCPGQCFLINFFSYNQIIIIQKIIKQV